MHDVSAENLFRKQAIAALGQRPYGRPVARLPRSWLWVVALLVCLAATAAWFILTVDVARKESVRGWLVAEAGVARVVHHAAGRVDELFAEAGDRIASGEPIMVISSDRRMDDGRSSAETMLAGLAKQVGDTEERIALLHRENDLELGSVAAQISSLKAERQSLQRQLSRQQRRVHAAVARLSALEALEETGAVSNWEVMRQADTVDTLQQEAGRLGQEEIAMAGRLTALGVRLEQLPVETGRGVAALRARVSELQQRISETRSNHKTVLTAPIAGRVASLEVAVGASVEPRRLLATIVPDEPLLAAEVYVPSRAVGFVHAGQRVYLQYDAFPYRQFGAFAGSVRHVSGSVLLPAEIPATFAIREATFRVRVEIDDAEVAFGSGRAELRPGMLLGAEIILENRKLWEWLLEPLRLRRRNATG